MCVCACDSQYLRVRVRACVQNDAGSPGSVIDACDRCDSCLSVDRGACVGPRVMMTVWIHRDACVRAPVVIRMGLRAEDARASVFMRGRKRAKVVRAFISPRFAIRALET